MRRFWETLVRPILESLKPRVILEIGSYMGQNTEVLLEFSRESGATLHAIDPLPLFDVTAWRAEYGDHFQFHLGKSLEVLSDLPVADIVLIDGDHNWYTVYHELKMLTETSAKHGRPFPIVLFHDIGWPYARRDLYYDPNDIPSEFRQAYDRKGVWPNRSTLHPYGINYHLANASREGGPRNGVLTAVEDFIRDCGESMHLLLIDGFNGLGVLYPTNLSQYAMATDELLQKLTLGVEVLGGHLKKLNDEIISDIVRRNREHLLRQNRGEMSAEPGVESVGRIREGTSE